jgi:excisionase family DNA binding protein
MDTRAAAAYLGISVSKAYRLAERQAIRHCRIGRRLLFRLEDIDRWIAKSP